MTQPEKFRLSINSSENTKTIVSLGSVVVAQNYENPRQQKILELVEEALHKAKLKPDDIKEIRVNSGPGSFTSIRAGFSVANAMAWVLGIKVI